MSLRIYAVDETQPPPRRLALDLECEGDHHGLLALKKCGHFHTEADGYLELRAAAKAAGWKWGGQVMGPCCFNGGAGA